jgi:hypothetical protein
MASLQQREVHHPGEGQRLVEPVGGPEVDPERAEERLGPPQHGIGDDEDEVAGRRREGGAQPVLLQFG